MQASCIGLLRYVKIFGISMLPLKNYLSKGGYFFTRGAMLRVNFVCKIHLYGSKKIMKAFCVGTLLRYVKTFDIAILLLKNYLSKRTTFLAPPQQYLEHFRMRYYIGGSILFKNVV